MKTIDEWAAVWGNDLRPLIEAVQSDAYHCGQMDGLEQADKVVRKTIGQVFGTRVESGEEL